MKDNKQIQSFNKHQENLNISDVRRSFSFTYDDLKKAFEDGKLYGDGELPLVGEFDFTNKPDLTAFDVWFDNWFKKNYV
jgi:hypothetical protein